MGTKEEMKKNVLAMFQYHRNEVEKYKKILDLLDDSGIPELSLKLDTTISEHNFPDYPFNEPLLVKYIFLEGKLGRWWSKNQMRQLIKQIEGPEKSKLTLKNDDQKIQYYVSTRKELMRIKVDSLVKYTFYSSQKEWIEETENGEFKIAEGHEPLPEFLLGLTEDQKQKIEYENLDEDVDEEK